MDFVSSLLRRIRTLALSTMRARSSGAPGRHRRAWIRPRRADPLLGLVLSSSPMAGDPSPRDAFHEIARQQRDPRGAGTAAQPGRGVGAAVGMHPPPLRPFYTMSSSRVATKPTGFPQGHTWVPKRGSGDGVWRYIASRKEGPDDKKTKSGQTP